MEPQFKGMPPVPHLRTAWQKAQEFQRNGILQSSHLTRKQRETLVRTGHLRSVMRGWYQLRENPQLEDAGPDLASFLPLYLEQRLGNQWCLSAASSLAVRCGEDPLPSQVVVQALYGSTTVHTFADGTRLTVYREENHLPTRLEMIRGLRVMAPETILARLTASQWDASLPLVDKLLDEVTGWESLVWHCLGEGRHQALVRLLDRFHTLGRLSEAETVAQGLAAAGLSVPDLPRTAQDPKTETPRAEAPPNPANPDLPLEECWSLWSSHIQPERFRPDNLPGNLLHRLASIEDGLPEDARHHLRLAGFEIPREAVEAIFMEPERAAEAAGWPLMEEIQARLDERGSPPLCGEVDPAALVALQGYVEALKLVKRSVVRMLQGRSLETILRQDMRGWRLALMNPSAEAGLITRRQILRYREKEGRDRVDTWMRLVAEEKDPGRRGILAFLGLSRLAPWEAGNRRMALLVLNALNTAAGLPWVVVRRSGEFQLAWAEALRPGPPDDLLKLLASSTLV